ncbi:MAG: hypothetical protein ACOCX2_06455 [Armatimonadota bacterium]
MRIMSWLRRAVADFFNADSDERDAEAERAREELEELRSLVMLAIAQARRTELELRDALDAETPGGIRLAELVPRLEEERARASTLLERYRRREAEEEQRLARLGQIRLAEDVNERREDLREDIDLASRTSRTEELTAMEDEARAEAFRLDVLDRLDAGEGHAPGTSSATEEEELTARARKLLEEPAIGHDEERA